jgi:hypothetical protein
MLTSQKYLVALVVIAGLNFAVGGVIWLSQRGDLLATGWSAIGMNLMGFAVLVAVLALAATAIVSAIEENAKKS